MKKAKCIMCAENKVGEQLCVFRKKMSAIKYAVIRLLIIAALSWRVWGGGGRCLTAKRQHHPQKCYEHVSRKRGVYFAMS